MGDKNVLVWAWCLGAEGAIVEISARDAEGKEAMPENTEPEHFATEDENYVLCPETGDDELLAGVSYSDIRYCAGCREVDPEIQITG